MPNKLTKNLEAIIKVSRQLLSQLDIKMANAIATNNENVYNNNLSINTEQLNDEQLLSLSNVRHSLISQLFETYSQKQLSAELTMVNEIVTLDEQLSLLSKNNKQVLAQQMSKLKNSNKVRDLYKKY